MVLPSLCTALFTFIIKSPICDLGMNFHLQSARVRCQLTLSQMAGLE